MAEVLSAQETWSYPPSFVEKWDQGIPTRIIAPYIPLAYFPPFAAPAVGVGMGLDSVHFSYSVLSLHSDKSSDQRVRLLTGTGTLDSPGPIRESWGSVFAP